MGSLPIPLENIHILYVEDDLINQMVIKNFLHLLGYPHLSIVSNAKEALDFLSEQDKHIHLILMDIGLPDMDGILLTKTIRQSENQSRHVPIIAVTGNSQQNYKTKCLQAGMNDFLSKPVEMETLRAILIKMLA